MGFSASSKERKKQRFVKGYTKYGLLFLPYILLQGIWTALFGRRNPIQIRDKVYLFLSHPKASKWQKWQRSIGKYFALTIFAWAVFIVVIRPPLFVVNLVAAELNISDYPQSETAQHIGSWTPWAATGLVLFAAFAARFHSSAVDNLKYL